MSILVYHNDEFTDLHYNIDRKTDRELARIWSSNQTKLVARVDTVSLEKAFVLTNNNFGHPWADNEEVECGTAHAFRSTSAGDFMVYECDLYVVNDFGFRLVRRD